MKRLWWAVLPLVVMLPGARSLAAPVQGQWTVTGFLQNAREFNAQVLMAGGKVLTMGGIDNNGNLLASAEIYSASTGAWALTGSMAAARELFPAVPLPNGKVLVSGGLGSGGTVLGMAELFDPATGTWSSAGTLSVPRFDHTATLLASGKVLVTGGCTVSGSCSPTGVSELYDPTSNTWSPTGSLTTPRYHQTAVRLKSGKVLVIGGSTGTPTTSCELYDPSSGTWSPAASTNVARYLNTTTLLADGKVLVTGGTLSRFPMSSAELYDPSSNTWTLTGNMTRGRYAHAATLLTDGDVLVAGGEGQSISCGKACTAYIPTATAEIYNEATGTFAGIASMSRATAYQSMTLLPVGRVLTDGGLGTTTICCVVIPDAAIYTPLTLTLSASSLSFGVLQIGLISAAQSVTVTNVSDHSVTFTSIAGSGDFAQSNTCPATLNPGQYCTITVTFTPTAAGTRKGAVTLQDNAAGSPAQIIALTGTGATNAMTLLPGKLTFPGQTPGTPSPPLSITLYDDGNSSVNLTTVGISPVSHTFTETNTCPQTMTPNTSCVIQVVFTPPDSGTYSAKLSITDSDSSSPQTAALSGTGLNN